MESCNDFLRRSRESSRAHWNGQESPDSIEGVSTRYDAIVGFLFRHVEGNWFISGNHSEEQLMRRSLPQVNNDQQQSTNALYEMLLDQEAKPDAEKASPLYPEKEGPSQEPPPDFQDIISTMERPSYQTADLERQSPVTRPTEERQTVVLRTQIQNAISRRRDSTNNCRSGDTDPLGTLLRARTMPVETRELIERPRSTKSEGDADA
jgi:hypothetical protein